MSKIAKPPWLVIMKCHQQVYCEHLMTACRGELHFQLRRPLLDIALLVGPTVRSVALRAKTAHLL